MKRAFARLLAGTALVGLICGSAAAQTVVVSGKSFTEQQIMTAMTVAALKAKGFTPGRHTRRSRKSTARRASSGSTCRA